MRNGKLMTTRVAAIALSSMMVLSPLTAFAAAPTGLGTVDNPYQVGDADAQVWAEKGDIYAEYRVNEKGEYIDENGNVTTDKEKARIKSSIQTGTIFVTPDPSDPTKTEEKNTYFLDSEETKKKTKTNKYGEEYEDVETAYFKKTISLRDYKNKTDFIPSVPDVVYTYEIFEAPGVDIDIPYTDKVGNPRSYNGAVIYPGEAGALSFGGEKTATLTFTHEDVANGDTVTTGLGKNDGSPFTMTRLMGFDIDVQKFRGKDPGVYRYLIIEMDEANIDGVTTGSAQDILDDVTKIADEYRGRVIDVVIEKVSADYDDDQRRVAGVALREVELEFEEEGKLNTWKIGRVEEEIKVEGYTPYSFNGKGSYEPGPKEAHSRYYTFDLLVDKEITGQGLTNEEALEKYYEILVDLEGPAGAKVTVVKSTAEETINDEENVKVTGNEVGSWVLDADGKLSKKVLLKNNQWFEISGLPSGAKYTVKEAKGSILSKVMTNKELNFTEAGTIKMDAADEKVDSVDHDLAIKSSKTDVTKNTDSAENVIVADSTIKKIKYADVEAVVDGEEVLEGIDVQNVLITNERLPITVTGVVMNVAPYALMVIAAAIFAGLFISKKRQEEEI